MSSPFIIGIVGGSASGKTWLLNELRKKYTEENLCIISQDDYYKPVEEQQMDEHGFLNFDLPSSIDENSFLNDLLNISSGREVRKLEYLFNHPEKKPEWKVFKPAPVLVCEGLFLLHNSRIRELLNLAVFMDAPEELQLERRLQRDIEERAIPEEMVMHQWNHHVLPAYRKYVLPYKDSVDIIIHHDNFDEGFRQLGFFIENAIS